MSIVGIIVGIIFVVLFYGGTNLFIGRRIFQCLNFIFRDINGKIFTFVYILCALSLIIGYLPLPLVIKRTMSFIGSYWMGIFVYLLLFLLFADLVILIGSLVKLIPHPIPQSIRLSSGLLSIILTVGLVSYGIINANHIKHVSYSVQTIENRLSGEMKIVLVSDLHLGAVNSEKNLEKVVEGINNLKPDIVCIAGDIFNDDFTAIHNPDKAIDLFNSIKTTYGVYASLGNHDSGNTFKEMTSLLEQSNIKLLNDEHVIVDNRLVLVGRLDPSPIGNFAELKRKDIKDVLTPIDTNLPIVVMDHTPSKLEQYDDSGVDLVLAGHTHRGQIFPANLITKAVYIVDYGYYQKDVDSTNFIVTSGAGTWGMPMRIGTNSEIVSITLK